MILQTFDPEKVNVIYNGRQLRMFGDDMFTLARDEASVTLKKGAKGDGTYVINANKAGKLTVTLQQQSPDVPYLTQCSEKNVCSNLTVIDANDNGSLLFAQKVMVEKMPDKTAGKDTKDVTIVFIIPDLKPQ